MASDALKDNGGPRPKVREDDRRGTPPGAGTITPAQGGRIGNPPFIPTEDQRQMVRTLAKTVSNTHTGNRLIATKMGFSVDTLLRHFAGDMDIGRSDLLLSAGATMVRAATDAAFAKTVPREQLDSLKFVLSRLGHWTGRVEVTGAGGGPIEFVDLSRLTPEQLEQYGRLAAAIAGIDPDTIIAVPR